MKSAISRLNQSGLNLDHEAVRTIQAASRPDWNPHEQLVLVTIPDVSIQTEPGLRMKAGVIGWSVSEAPSPANLPPATTAQPAPSSSLSPSLLSLPHSSETELSGDSRSCTNPTPVAERKTQISSNLQRAFAEDASKEKVTPQSGGVGREVGMDAAHRGGEPDRTATSNSAVVESLVSRFASDASCLIHFCDTDRPQRAAEVCLSVGMEFAERIQRRVLLLDVSRASRPLSCLLGVELAAGFREVLRTELNWRHLVRQTSHPLVDVLPAGVIKLSTTAILADFEFQIRRLMVELATQYGGVFTCADNAFDLESELIGLCSSGGFLTIDFQRTSRGLAKSAANQLRSSGTRLLGCIAAAESKPG